VGGYRSAPYVLSMAYSLMSEHDWICKDCRHAESEHQGSCGHDGCSCSLFRPTWAQLNHEAVNVMRSDPQREFMGGSDFA
jgi:hypothetical protein